MRFVHVPVLGAGGFSPITLRTGTVCLAKNAAAAASRCRLRARPAAQRVQECGSNGICEHGRVRSACKECGGGRSVGTAWVGVQQG